MSKIGDNGTALLLLLLHWCRKQVVGCGCEAASGCAIDTSLAHKPAVRANI
jgi:hypothetical protein